jgi:trans-aconitate 2-methyltransferase
MAEATAMTTTNWDAATYDRVSFPQTRWGTAVLARLDLRGDETVVDAGCGSGRVTEQLLERLPHGRVIALDADAAMLAEARKRLAPYGQRVSFAVHDLQQPLPVEAPVDAILSTAVLHWIPDQDAVARNFVAALKPDGQLVVQCGGFGNIDLIMAAIRRAGMAWAGPWHYAPAEEARERYTRNGFISVEAWLNEEPTPFETDEQLQTFLATVILRAHLTRLPDDERHAFVRSVAAALPSRTIDYVRLNIVARRAS